LPIQGSERMEGRVPELMMVSQFVWDGETYTHLMVEKGVRGLPNLMGLRFLARHRVTFDFPNAMMYLKRNRSRPPSQDKALESLGAEWGGVAGRSQPTRPDCSELR
jgi:hypothetical protein